MPMYEWRCSECDLVVERLGKYEDDKRAFLLCHECGEVTMHSRIMSMPAKYVYDRPYAPLVYGGKYDTTGQRETVRLPDIPDGAEYDKARDILTSKKWAERAEMKVAQMRENKAKRARLAAMKRGETDLRRSPLPGDPPLEKFRGKRVLTK